MLVSGHPPQYPHLVTFLDHQRRNPTRRNKGGIPIGAIVSGVLFAALLLGDRLPIIKWLAMVVLVGLAGWFVYQYTQASNQPAPDVDSRLRKEATEAGALMRAALH